VGKKSGYGMQNRPYNMLMPYQPHPFIGSWDNPTVGMGMKKKQKEKRKQKKREEFSFWEKVHPSTESHY